MTCIVFKKGLYWHYRFQIKPFPRVQRSTRLRHQGRAQKLASEAYADALLLANGGKPIPTLQQVIDRWMVLRAPVVSRAYTSSVDIFARLHLYGMGTLRLDRIDKETVELARLEHLKGRNKATANHWLRILKMLINWSDALPQLPFKLKGFKLQKNPRIMLPISATEKWFAAVDDRSRRRQGVGMLVRLMLYMGLRESEAITARWEWFDWERGTYTPGITKGKEAVALPMDGRLIRYLVPLKRAEGLVATRPDGRPLPKGFAVNAMKGACLACGIPGITPHRLRGTIATLMSEQGVSIQNIQKFLRHKDSLTTMAYLEKNMDLVKKAQDDIGDLIENAWRQNGADQSANPHG